MTQLISYASKTNNKKQNKLSKTQHEQLVVKWRQHNKEMRRKHLHDMQFKDFEDYVAYIFGNKKNTKKKFETYVPKQTYRRETKHYPSLVTNKSEQCVKTPPKLYSGQRKLLGIATLHKSNAVPIFDEDKDYVKDIAKMRRN